MIQDQRVVVLDVDGTICAFLTPTTTYASVAPVMPVVERLRELYADGWHIILYTSRRMRSFKGNIGLINAHVVPELTEWLRRHDIPFHEIHIGKPWAGHEGFYVDDRAIRPDEFATLSLEEIRQITGLR